MSMFILSSYNDDSILASKIVNLFYPKSKHLSASRKRIAGNPGDSLVFIRPYVSTELFTNPQGYQCSYDITIFDYRTSELYLHKNVLVENGCRCIWVDEDLTMSEAVWKHYYGTKPVPTIIKLTRDYMKWELMIDHSMPFHYGMSIIPSKFTDEAAAVYFKLLENDSYTLDKIISDGKQIQKYLNIIYSEIHKELVFESEFNDLKIVCANIHGVNSRFFNNIADDNFDLAMTFTYVMSTSKIRHTFYQINPEIDAKKAVEKYNGVGHSGSSSFMDNVLAINKSKHIPMEIDYNKIMGPTDLPDSVVEYINIFHIVKMFNSKYCIYNNKKAILANTPFLTHMPLFSNIRDDIELCVTFCMTASNMYRISVSKPDGQDPGVEYGKLYGRYRISIQPELIMADKKYIGSDPFWSE